MRKDPEAELRLDLSKNTSQSVWFRVRLFVGASNDNYAIPQQSSTDTKAIEEERYEDATFLRDHTGAGLVGWWAGVSQDHKDPYSQIIHISPVHGKFVAKSYSPW
ncbi:hypothetical protein POM88_012378 [Heracleum sosnowskyi]|uniref:Uncharacterized protein n=1 Tax=Heracleum sosnowskyi TaxID=360622 RepID=A0AAD8IWE0_9APIA|nr:hypothetical protein POM88_012378 [Heracleum sosnowskyi]